MSLESIEAKLDILIAKFDHIDGAVTPPAPVVVNPFIKWKAEGFDLVQIQMWRLYRGLTPAEIEQARAAGYDIKDAPPVVDVPLTGNLWNDHRWPAGEFAAGGSKSDELIVPEGWGGKLELGISCSPSGAAKLYFLDAAGNGGEVTGAFTPVPGTYTLRVDANHACGVSVDVWHTP